MLRRYSYIGFVVAGIMLLSLVPRMLSLEAHWSSDEVRWLGRSYDFMLAVLDGDLPGTFQAYHPGVTTMWLGGLSLWSRYKRALSVAPLLPSHPFLSPENLASTRLPVALVTGMVILGACLLVWRLLEVTSSGGQEEKHCGLRNADCELKNQDSPMASNPKSQIPNPKSPHLLPSSPPFRLLLAALTGVFLLLTLFVVTGDSPPETRLS